MKNKKITSRNGLTEGLYRHNLESRIPIKL